MGLKTMKKIDKSKGKKHVFVQGKFKQCTYTGPVCCTPGTV